MEVAFFFVIGWIIFSHIVAEVLPHLFQLLGMLIRFLCLCIWEILQLLGKIAAFVGKYGFRAARWTCSQSWLFLIILLDEWRHGPAAEEAEEELFEDEEGEEDQRQAAYDAALALLGLKEPFELADLKRVYRQAMKREHTDVGGTKEAAAGLNAARDLVMEARGWK